MKLTIVVPDGVVGIDGEFFRVDLNSLDQEIRAVQWNGQSGHIEWADGRFPTDITNINDLQTIVAMWQVAKDADTLANTLPNKTASDMWEEIKAERERRMSGGFKVEVQPGVFKWYHSDQTSRIQHLGLFILGASVPPIPWKTMDGTFESMTQAIAAAIFSAALTLDSTLYTRAEQHKALMEASGNPGDYDYSTGWPENYLGI